MGASLSLKFTQNSQSIANNSTNVTIEVWIAWTYGTWNGYSPEGQLVIDGKAYAFASSFNTSATNSGSQKLFGKTVDIVHNSDGNKKLDYSASFEYHTGKTITASGSQTLPLIARASQPSCITWPNHTQKVGSFGDTISIHTNRASSSLTHTLRYQFGSASGTIATNVGTGTTWKIPMDLMNLIPSVTSGSGTIYCDTYSGNTLVGTRSCGFTATVPASVKPSCTFALEDITGTDDIYGGPVQALSKIKVTVSTTTAYSSPIASCTIEANGATYLGTTATTGVLQASGGSDVKVTVKDKRGRAGSAVYTMNVQAYAPPVISDLTLRRCNADGSENEEGSYLQVTFSAAISGMGGKNTAAYELRYKSTTADSYTTVAFSALVNKYAVDNQTHILPANTEETFDIEIAATDKHSTVTRSTTGSTAFTLMDWHASGTGIAFGKVSQKANTMEIGLDVEFLGAVRGAIFDAVWPVGSIYLAYNHANPSTLFGGTWVRITNAFLWATDAAGIIGQTGGAREVTLTTEQLPRHHHGSTYTGEAINGAGTDKIYAWYGTSGTNMAYGQVVVGGDQAHNNMPPYTQVSVWRRTA